MTLEEKLERLDATIHLLTAGLGASVCVTDEVIKAAKQQGLEMPDLEFLYLKYRKELLHRALEQIEKNDSGRAARLFEILDDRNDEFPLSYD